MSRNSTHIHLAISGFVVGLLASVAFLFSQSNADEQSSDTFIQGVSRAYDGDGIYVAGVKIRLWGIDAPELLTDEGEAALASLAGLVDGKWVICSPPPNETTFPKSHDRKVALCTIKGNDLAKFQVQSGHARDWPRFSNGYYRQ